MKLCEVHKRQMPLPLHFSPLLIGECCEARQGKIRASDGYPLISVPSSSGNAVKLPQSMCNGGYGRDISVPSSSGNAVKLEPAGAGPAGPVAHFSPLLIGECCEAVSSPSIVAYAQSIHFSPLLIGECCEAAAKIREKTHTFAANPAIILRNT